MRDLEFIFNFLIFLYLLFVVPIFCFVDFQYISMVLIFISTIFVFFFTVFVVSIIDFQRLVRSNLQAGAGLRRAGLANRPGSARPAAMPRVACLYVISSVLCELLHNYCISLN